MRTLAESPYRRRGQRRWTVLHRARQAMQCRRHRPWRSSTGPRNMAGIARSCANGLKHGMRSAPMRELSRLLRLEKKLISQLMKRTTVNVLTG